MYDLVVVGAGPYGLSVAAHAARAGLDVKVFGRPMASWLRHMPPGMFLKSEPWASNLSDPDGAHTLAAYSAAQGTPARHGVPVPVRFFAAYGLWFARQAAPPADEREVVSVRPGPGGFLVTTADGEPVLTRTVALAVGVMPFVEVPEVLRGLPPELASHSSHHAGLGHFEGRDVTVVGAGQAALETAALLAEQGTRVRVVARSPALDWNTPPPPLARPLAQRVRGPHTGLGCGWRNWLYAETPGAFRRLPAATRARVFASALGPAGAWWLRERFEGAVEVRLGEQIVAAAPAGGRLRLRLADADGGTARLETDHVVAATGFTPALDRLALLAPELRDGLATVADGGGPEASGCFESSYPGLFLAGLLSAPSFGPSMRFVHGATYTAERLVRGVRRRLRPAGGSPGLVAPRAAEKLPARGRAAGVMP
ncbi:FAD-dependent oxidoreductase [Streptomyces fuscigenes]|uniref:FAD-dependent oxidoreductase n=1 Tax=Streptomyces fuscigenes TaxID=1528880 RepID=UPI001F220A61|nr:FAD-dependent oxidoreductase [Streptomyces fuscigenes]MCF3965424.1 NAD(P)-binding domain-containing protein [Streptomyces fuscigenes]